MRIPLQLLLAGTLIACAVVSNAEEKPDFSPARKSSEIAGTTLSKVQRWLQEVALKKIDPKTNLYISHHEGSARYPESLWNYDDTAADTYPFLFWAAWYTDYAQIHGPVLEVLKAEQRICNHIDRIPTAVNHKTLEKIIKSKDDTIFAATEYLKDGLIAIIEVSGTDTPWFERLRDIMDDIWTHADIKTPYGLIPTENLEANGEQIQVLARLYTITGEKKYLEWAERLADLYLLDDKFMPTQLRDHGCEVIGGLGLLLGVESVHNPAKAAVYRPRLRRILDKILEKGLNEDGVMFNTLGDPKSGLSDSWGYNYVAYLCYDMTVNHPVYGDHLKRTLTNLAKPKYTNYPWEGDTVDGFADSVEGALYLLNRLHVPEAVAWTNSETANNIVFAGKDRIWTTYKLESNGVRTALQHAMMHTQGLIARPWKQGMSLGASPAEKGLAVVLKSPADWSGKLVFDIARHRHYMKFARDWPRINAMPEWFTVEMDKQYIVRDLGQDKHATYSGKQLHEGLPLELSAGKERLLVIQLVE